MRTLFLAAAIAAVPTLARADAAGAASHLTGAQPLSGGALAALELSGDGRVDAADVVRALSASAPSEARLALQAIGTPYDAGRLGSDAVSILAFSLFYASNLNGGSTTATGTLTSQDDTDENYTYMATPTDRMVLVTFSGRRIEWVLNLASASGNTSGTWEDFVAQHNIDFTFAEAGRYDVRVESQKDYTTPGARAWTAAWTRTMTGSYVNGGETVMLDITHQGTENGSIESPFSELSTSESYAGTTTSPSATVNVNESSFYYFIQNSSQSVIVRNFGITSNSSAAFGGNTYQYNNANVRWETYSLLTDPGQFNVVKDSDYWQVGGNMTKNGGAFGTLEFSGPVTPGTKGPDLLMRFQNGSTTLLHTLIPDL